MRLLILVKLSVVAFICGSAAFAQPSRSYSIDPQECVGKLEWNSNFTRAKCKVRNGAVVDSQGLTSVNFSTPVVDGWPDIKVFIDPLRNGYVLRLEAVVPVVPSEIAPLLAWALSVAASPGIARPEGLCAHFLSEVRGLF